MDFAVLPVWIMGAWIAALAYLCLTRICYADLLTETDGSPSAPSRAPMLATTIIIAARHLLMLFADPDRQLAPVSGTELALMGVANLTYLADKSALARGLAPPVATLARKILGQRSP